MTPGKQRIIALTVCVAIGAALWRFSLRETNTRAPRAELPSGRVEDGPAASSEAKPRPARVVAPNQQIRPDQPALSALPPPREPEAEKSHLADQLHAPNRTGMQDVSVVMNLFTHYRTRFQGYPVGEDNATFVNALSGNNPGRLAFIDRHHPAIDAQGQLLDRWGEPFFFHLIGRDALEIRSAGPDRELYTGDDLLTSSPKANEGILTAENR